MMAATARIARCLADRHAPTSAAIDAANDFRQRARSAIRDRKTHDAHHASDAGHASVAMRGKVIAQPGSGHRAPRQGPRHEYADMLDVADLHQRYIDLDPTEQVHVAAARGVEKIAASWAERNGTTRSSASRTVGFAGRAAPFRRNVRPPACCRSRRHRLPRQPDTGASSTRRGSSAFRFRASRPDRTARTFTGRVRSGGAVAGAGGQPPAATNACAPEPRARLGAGPSARQRHAGSLGVSRSASSAASHACRASRREPRRQATLRQRRSAGQIAVPARLSAAPRMRTPCIVSGAGCPPSYL